MTEKLEDHTEDLTESTTDEVAETEVTEPESVENETEETPVDNSDNDGEDAPDSFPREYVEKLRDENAKYRQRAQRSDDLTQRLHQAPVADTGCFQDHSDLTINEAHLEHHT